MAGSRLRDTASVPIVLRISVSEDDVAQVDQVLARPEFAGWSRSEWCREIIRTALRYYVGEPAGSEADQAPAAARAAEPAPTREVREVREVREAPVPAEEAPPLLVADEATPEPQDRRYCAHPPDARDYQTGTCAACGAILWD